MGGNVLVAQHLDGVTDGDALHNQRIKGFSVGGFEE
jgi:hypothetical protein